jgi:hypothetical protein
VRARYDTVRYAACIDCCFCPDQTRLRYSMPHGRYETFTHTDVLVDWESVCDLVNSFRTFFRLVEPYSTVQVRRATYSRERYLTSPPSPTGRSHPPLHLYFLLLPISIFVGSNRSHFGSISHPERPRFLSPVLWTLSQATWLLFKPTYPCPPFGGNPIRLSNLCIAAPGKEGLSAGTRSGTRSCLALKDICRL